MNQISIEIFQKQNRKKPVHKDVPSKVKSRAGKTTITFSNANETRNNHFRMEIPFECLLRWMLNSIQSDAEKVSRAAELLLATSKAHILEEEIFPKNSGVNLFEGIKSET